MRKWFYDNPWIWVVVFLTVLVAGSVVTLVIAQLNRPEIVKEKQVSLSAAPVPGASWQAGLMVSSGGRPV